MKIILVALLVIIGEAAGGSGGRGRRGKHGAGYGGPPGQRPPPSPTNNINYGNQNQPWYDYYALPPPNQNLGCAYLTASPSITVAAGAPVTVTCKFSAPINKKSVFFSIGDGDNMDDSNVLMFDTSSIAVGQTMMIADQVGVVVNDASISLVYYKAKTSDSGVYQCYIPNIATSNELTVTVTAQPSCNKTTLIVAITVPLVIVLAVFITMLAMRYCCGYRCQGMKFRRMQQPATGAEVEVGKMPDGKLDVLDPAKLPASDVATDAPEMMYQPPGYDEAVYGKGYDADASVQVKSDSASLKKYIA